MDTRQKMTPEKKTVSEKKDTENDILEKGHKKQSAKAETEKAEPKKKILTRGEPEADRQRRDTRRRRKHTYIHILIRTSPRE